MTWFDHVSAGFVLAVAAFAFGAQVQSQRPDSFASRWSPVLIMPSEGMTIKAVDRWTH